MTDAQWEMNQLRPELLSPGAARQERAVSPQDIISRFVMSYVVEIPFAGGRQINGIATMGTGVPLPITTQISSNAFSGVQRPNISGDSNLDSGRSTNGKNNQWFNTRVFSQLEYPRIRRTGTDVWRRKLRRKSERSGTTRARFS